MSRAGRITDRKSEWCPSAGKYCKGAKVLWLNGQVRCPTCGRVFDVNEEWLLKCRMPHHKRPEDVQDHHRPSKARLQR